MKNDPMVDLFHGTSPENIPAIMEQGLKPTSRPPHNKKGVWANVDRVWGQVEPTQSIIHFQAPLSSLKEGVGSGGAMLKDVKSGAKSAEDLYDQVVLLPKHVSPEQFVKVYPTKRDWEKDFYSK